MKKLIPMAAAAVCIASAAFASISRPAAAVVNARYAVVDTVIPQDTTQPPATDTAITPAPDTLPTPADTTTDTSSVSQ